MFFTKSEKKSFLDLLQSRNARNIFNIKELPLDIYLSLNDEELLFIWKDEPSNNHYFPIYICTPTKKSKEFLAWASTYLKTLKPFTAFTRVVDIDEIQMLQNTKPIELPIQIENAFTGAIIGEIVELNKLGIIKHQNLMAARSTFSYTIAMSHILSSPHKKIEIARRYDAVRKLASMSVMPSYLTYLQGIWQNFLSTIGINFDDNNVFQERLSFPPIKYALSSLANGSEITRTHIIDILHHPIELPDIPSIDSKIEIRVEQFEKVCAVISSNKQIHPQSASFVIACLANQITPGSFKHLALLEPYYRNYPGVYIWYGLCSGLNFNSDIMSYNSGLGWRISKQLLSKSTVFEKSAADICFNEYEMLLTLDKQDTFFNTEYANSLTIELVPGISTLISWPPKSEFRESKYPNQMQFDMGYRSSNTDDIMLKKLGEKLYETINIFEKLTGSNIKPTKADNKTKNRSTKGKKNY